jgi:two-component system cell cycle sensor histidine kinase/response regulator CckA
MVPLLGLQPQTLLQSVLDNVGVAIAVIDREGRFVFTNRAALDILGATENLSVAEWRRDYKFHDSQGREIPVGQAPIMRAFAGEEVEPHEVRVTFPDGRMKWLHVAGHPFSVLGLRGVLMIVTDETEQIELRKEIERAQQIETIGVLAGGLAHDFNNILSILLGNISLGLKDEGVQDITTTRLQQMGLAVRTGTALVARLMQYSRQHEVQTHPLQVNEAVNAALELTRPLFTRRLHINVEMSDNLPAIQADILSLEQVLVNLILNALDAMPKGGELSLSTELISETQEAGKDVGKKQFVLITVADTGIGIPEHIQPSIFDPFFTTKRGGKGVGLGLSSAQEIVHQHNGYIKVQSAPDSGTKFRIYLPVGRAAASPNLGFPRRRQKRVTRINK